MAVLRGIWLSFPSRKGDEGWGGLASLEEAVATRV